MKYITLITQFRVFSIPTMLVAINSDSNKGAMKNETLRSTGYNAGFIGFTIATVGWTFQRFRSWLMVGGLSLILLIGWLLITPVQADVIINPVNASVTHVIFENDVDNYGWISNSTIGPEATLTGGTLTGAITNEGVIANVNFVGIELSGGTLSGTVVNNSKVGGIVRDVQLAKDTILKGGKVGGSISGDDCNNPALITAGEILPGTVLSNVRLSPTVQRPKDVGLESCVILPGEPPSLADFGLKPLDLTQLYAKTLAELEPAVFGILSAEEIKLIPAAAFSAIKPEQLAEIQKETLKGLTTEQFKQIPFESLSGLTSENMGGLSIEVLAMFTPAHLNALDAKAFKAMPSKDVSKLFTNFDGDKITPADIESLVPSDWKVDLETGELTAPDGAELTLRALPTPEDLPAAVELPLDMVDLNKGFGLGGAGTPVIEGLTDAFTVANFGNLGNFTSSQTNEGIFQIKSPQNRYTFIPDVNDIVKVDSQKEPVGLSIGNGGFYLLTTPNAIQIPLIPATQNPIALSETIGDNMVIMGNRGDVFMELSYQRRRGKTRQVVIFDPFIEPGIDDSCVEIVPGEFACDEFDGLRPGVQTRKIKYPDGTAQTIYPTVLSPDVFIKEGFKFEGVENIVFNTNGTFYVAFEGKPYLVIPSFEVLRSELPDGKFVEPSIELKEGGQIRYTIPIEVSEDDNRRRGKTREVLIFDPFIEPAPDDMCTEPVPGVIVCDFD